MQFCSRIGFRTAPNADPVIWIEKQKEQRNQGTDQKGKEKPPVPYANDNGIKLWYTIDGTGEPLVVSGGFGLLDDQFAKIRHLLASELQVID